MYCWAQCSLFNAIIWFKAFLIHSSTLYHSLKNEIGAVPVWISTQNPG